MSYVKTQWVNGDTITADKLNHIEAGIEANETENSLLKSHLQDISEISGSGAETSVAVDFSDVRNGFATSTIGSNAAIAATSTKTKTIVKAVQVVAGRRYKFVIKNGSTVTISASRTLVFTNSSNVITEVLYYTNSPTGNESTTIYHTPSNSGYVWIGVDFTYASVAAYEVAFTYTALDAVSRSYEYKNFAVNLLNPDDVLVNQACPLTAGSLITDVSARNGYISTKPIAVRAGEKYIFNAQGYLTNIIYADDGGYVLSLNTLAANTPFTIPDGVFYMQYSFSQNTTYFNNNQWKDRVMLIKGESIPTYFLPYGKYAVSDATEVLSPIATLTGRKKKAYIILNFDAAEDAETGFFTYRKSLLDAYGLKGCPCLNRAVLNNDFDDWASELNKTQYFNLLKDGWDVGLYVSQRGDSMNESQWDTFLATVKTALSGLGVYNIVGFHCTGNNLTQDLFNALKKAEFKVVRSTTNTFQPSFYAPLVVTDETLIPIATMAIDANTVASDMKANIDNAISAGSTLALMAHLVLDTTGTIDSYNCYASVFTEIIAYIKSKVDAGDVEVITWRELYQMMNPHDSNEYDYNRLFKMYSASV